MTRNTLRNGETLILNLDESESSYKEAFYPDLKEFYDSAGFNSSTWSRELMRRKEIYERVTGQELLRHSALMMISKGFPAGVAEVVTAGAGHMGAALHFLDDLFALFALAVLSVHFEIDCDEGFALTLVVEFSAFVAVPRFAMITH
ncbi:unnamed protein product [Sphagnum balticum]